MTDDKRPQETSKDEVEEMVAELEGRDAKSGLPYTSIFPSGFQARGKKQAPCWPAGFAAVGTKTAPSLRWPARFIARGVKPAR